MPLRILLRVLAQGSRKAAMQCIPGGVRPGVHEPRPELRCLAAAQDLRGNEREHMGTVAAATLDPTWADQVGGRHHGQQRAAILPARLVCARVQQQLAADAALQQHAVAQS